MKKRISLILMVTICVLSTGCISAEEINKTGINEIEEQAIKENIPRLSSEFVDSLTSKKGKFVQEKNEEYKNELLTKRTWLTLDLEKLEKEYKNNPNDEIGIQVTELKQKLEDVEHEIEELGLVTLTQEQIAAMFEEIGLSSGTIARDSVPIGTVNTKNTKYTTDGPHTISTADGDCTYFCITATVNSTDSNMYSTQFIPMNENKVYEYEKSLTEIYVSKALGTTIGAWFKYAEYFPWELFQSPPESHYETTASYTITAGYATNVKFVWYYAPAYNNYYLGVILHSTSCRDVHVSNYIYDGEVKGTERVNEYILECPNYNNVEGIMREYWEGLELIHSERIDGIKYYYNGVVKKTITPPYAQGMHDMN